MRPGERATHKEVEIRQMLNALFRAMKKKKHKKTEVEKRLPSAPALCSDKVSSEFLFYFDASNLGPNLRTWSNPL